MMFSSLCLAVLSFAAQCVLGWLLVREDFGLFALAAGMATMLQVMRDGGVSLWLARQTPEELKENQPEAFWLIVITALSVTGALACLGPVAAVVYDQPELRNLVWILASSMLIDAVSIVPEAHLQVHFRFRSLSTLRILCGLTRHVSAIALAASGWGVYSLVIPVVFIALLRFSFTFGVTGIRPWKGGFDLARCRNAFRQSRWAMMGALAYALLGQIDYLMLGFVASVSVVGVYFFAYQICYQPVMLVAQSIRGVIIPTFARIGGDPQRGLRASARGIRFIAVLGTLSIVYVALCIGYVENLIWHGKWADAVLPVQIISLAMPIHLLADVAAMMAQSRGKFRTVATVIALRGLGLGAAVLASGWAGGADKATIVAAIVAMYLGFSGLVGSAYFFHSLGLPVKTSIMEFIVPFTSIVFIALAILLGAKQLQLGITLENLAFFTLAYLVASICAIWFILPNYAQEVLQTVRQAIGMSETNSSSISPR
jgi:teichuronic acid exporter